MKKKKEYYEKTWARNGSLILKKIEIVCGDIFTNTSKNEGISVILYKKATKDRDSYLDENNPLEIHLLIPKNDTSGALKENLIRMLTHSYIKQKIEFHFRIREQTLFEDILADELFTSIVAFAIMGKKSGRANCEKALNQAINETVYRLGQKTTKNRLIDLLNNFSKQYSTKIKNQKNDLLEQREELITKLLEFLPQTLINE